MIETIVLDRARPANLMKLWKWLLTALAIAGIFAGLVSSGFFTGSKTIYVKAVGTLYGKDGVEQPATAFIEFDMWPRWIWWSREQGDWSLEMTDPVTIDEHGYVRGFSSGKHTLVNHGFPESDRKMVGLFSSQSSAIGIETAKGNFVGECERHDPIWLYNGRP
jgi:hypothetical protein